jgi:nucleotide-binding universal stress UspA family protein
MKIERIVVAIDFSERSIAAAQWVARHFAPRSEIVLAHALELPPPPLFLRGRASWREDDVETCRTGARVRLRQLGAQIGRGLIWEEVRVGRAHDEVLRVAGEYHADLIVVGSHRDREAFWNRLGTTAERVMGRSRVPVLVVHGTPRDVPRILLAAVDDSETGARVIEHARTLAERFRARGKVVHVLPNEAIAQLLKPGEITGYDYRLDEAEQHLIRATQEWLATQLAEAPNELRSAVRVGDPTETILAEARETGSHLLVIGRERKSGPRRFLLGSVASAVTRVANCPVLVIPSEIAADHACGRDSLPAAVEAEDAAFTGLLP